MSEQQTEAAEVIRAAKFHRVELGKGPQLFAVAATVHTPRENFKLHHSGIAVTEEGRYAVLVQVSVSFRKLDEDEP